MFIKVKGFPKKVDVSKKICPTLPCFHPCENKGSFTPGRGYTSYYENPDWVCMTRHDHGCPRIGICLDCRTIVCMGDAEKCGWCGSTNIKLDEETNET